MATFNELLVLLREERDRALLDGNMYRVKVMDRKIGEVLESLKNAGC